MSKSHDAKKNVKKEAAKTPKEKKEEKRAKKLQNNKNSQTIIEKVTVKWLFLFPRTSV